MPMTPAPDNNDMTGKPPAIGTDPLAEPVRRLNGVNVTEALRLLQLAGIDNPLAHNADATAALQRVVDGLCAVSSQDGLTGLANRRSFWNALEREIERSARTGEVVAQQLQQIADRFLPDQLGRPVVLEFVGAIPSDPAVERSVRARVPVVLHAPGAPAAQALQELARALDRQPQRPRGLRPLEEQPVARQASPRRGNVPSPS